MKLITWDDYYYGLYVGWSLKTQKNYSYGLTDFGSSDEVYDVVSELSFHDPKFAMCFVEKGAYGRRPFFAGLWAKQGEASIAKSLSNAAFNVWQARRVVDHPHA